MEKIPPEKRSLTIEWKICRNPRFSPNPRIFGRAGLSISLSRAKFVEQADFDIRSAVARPKPRLIDEKQNFRSEIFVEIVFRCRKTKRPKSSETRFGKVSWRSEPCSSSYEKIFTSILRRELIPQPHINVDVHVKSWVQTPVASLANSEKEREAEQAEEIKASETKHEAT